VEGIAGASVGATLRDVRRQRRLSLADVAARSENEFKASSLGAYERGDRANSVARLQRLAQIYGVSVESLLQCEPHMVIDLVQLERAERGGIVLDLSTLRMSTDPEAVAVMNFAAGIKAIRKEPSFSVIVVRRSDAAMLAALLGTDPAKVDFGISELSHRSRDLARMSAVR
jgi:transcriptional regulator with XRE-family HTH domain